VQYIEAKRPGSAEADREPSGVDLAWQRVDPVATQKTANPQARRIFLCDAVPAGGRENRGDNVISIKTTTAIAAAIAEFPDLNPNGFGGVGEVGEWNHKEIETAIAFLQLCGGAKQPTHGSYTLKHMAEDWGAQSGQPYIGNGELIVAAHALGFVIKRYSRGSPNAGIGVRKRVLAKIMRPLGWSS
jgi:hypothetical protein